MEMGQRGTLCGLCGSVFLFWARTVRGRRWKHGGTEARSISAQWVSLRGEGRVTENEVANWTDASLFALLS